MNLHDVLIKNVRKRLKELNWPQSKLADEMQIFPQLISRYLKKNGVKPGLDAVGSMAKALGVSASRLFEETKK